MEAGNYELKGEVKQKQKVMKYTQPKKMIGRVSHLKDLINLHRRWSAKFEIGTMASNPI